jgi:Uma2 family endonuclease
MTITTQIQQQMNAITIETPEERWSLEQFVQAYPIGMKNHQKYYDDIIIITILSPEQMEAMHDIYFEYFPQFIYELLYTNKADDDYDLFIEEWSMTY